MIANWAPGANDASSSGADDVSPKTRVGNAEELARNRRNRHGTRCALETATALVRPQIFHTNSKVFKLNDKLQKVEATSK